MKKKKLNIFISYNYRKLAEFTFIAHSNKINHSLLRIEKLCEKINLKYVLIVNFSPGMH